MRTSCLALASLLSAASSALAQSPDFRGTVNEITPSQEEKARAAVVHAGYQPTVLEFGQDGNLFFTATRGGRVYEVTVTPSGQVFANNGLPATKKGG